MGAEVNTDVEVENTTDAIQEHNIGSETVNEPEELENAQDTTEIDEEKPPRFISDRDRLANEILERQRQERNRDIEVDLGLERHPEYQKVEEENISEENKISDENIQQQEETESNEIDEDEEENELSETEDNKNIPDSSKDNVDQNKNNDLQFNKPGVYGDQVVLKIDGQLTRIPVDKALSILQKNQSADKRLENVVLRERQLTLREEQLKAHPQPSEPEPRPQPDVVEDADIEQRARTIVQSVEDGEQEKAVESLVSLVKDTVGRPSMQPEPTLTPDQIANMVVQQTRALEANSVESHLKASGNYDDIFNDQVAYGLAISNVQNLTSSGYEGSTEQVMIEAMERVRDWRSGLSRELRLESLNKSTSTSKSTSKPNLEISESQRLENKRKSPKAVKSSTTIKRAAVKPESEPSEVEKRNEIINQMRAARNQ